MANLCIGICRHQHPHSIASSHGAFTLRSSLYNPETTVFFFFIVLLLRSSLYHPDSTESFLLVVWGAPRANQTPIPLLFVTFLRDVCEYT